jgi:hypothetical protein
VNSASAMPDAAQLQHARQLIRHLYDARPLLCDVEIHCVSDVVGEGFVVLYAHRAILAAKCRCGRLFCATIAAIQRSALPAQATPARACCVWLKLFPCSKVRRQRSAQGTADQARSLLAPSQVVTACDTRRMRARRHPLALSCGQLLPVP